MCNISEDVQYESGTSSVRARMRSTNQAHLQHEQEYAEPIKHIFSMREDEQYKQIYHQVLVQGDTTKILSIK